ncbi:uncharacterized protein [Rutidosis leptorrhynchoides]|uniref:uncharacterized protein n=1 Tax=Rutidosis leptorrhynchoides TaxID=125765 RepID=UPI003A99A0C7
MVKQTDIKTNDGKRKWDRNQGNNFNQYHNKKLDVAKSHNTWRNDKRGYIGNQLLCNKCGKHHHGICLMVCGRCNKIGHMANDCRSTAPATNKIAPGNCYGCGQTRHFKNNCPNTKGDGTTHGRAFVITVEEARHDPALVTGMFLLNNCYASVLFDTGAFRSFVSKKFSSLFNMPSTTLDVKYSIDLANGKLMRVDKILEDCTINLADKVFKVNLMMIELGSFDVVIGMNWLSKNKAEIVCFEKSICIPLTDGETLVI